MPALFACITSNVNVFFPHTHAHSGESPAETSGSHTAASLSADLVSQDHVAPRGKRQRAFTADNTDDWSIGVLFWVDTNYIYFEFHLKGYQFVFRANLLYYKKIRYLKNILFQCDMLQAVRSATDAFCSTIYGRQNISYERLTQEEGKPRVVYLPPYHMYNHN